MNSFNFTANIEDIYIEEDLVIPQKLQMISDSSKNLQENSKTDLTGEYQSNLRGSFGISDLSNDTMEEHSFEMQLMSQPNEPKSIQEKFNHTQYEKNNFSQTLSIKKFIVKTKRTSSKRFKRKQYQSYYSHFTEQHQYNNTFIIFGYIQIEANYHDFTDSSLEAKSQLCDQVIQINHAINNKLQKRVEFYLDPIGRSGLTDFNELITHLNSKENQSYTALSSQLLLYQIALGKQISHMKEIKKMVTKKVISESDLVHAFDSCHSYFIDYLASINSMQQETSFTHTLFFRTNVNYCDPEIYQTHFSHSLLQLLGINPEDSKNLIQISSPYQVSKGMKRLKNATTILSIINSKQKFHSDLPFTISTNEGFEIDCTVDVELINYPERPVWMNGFDCFMLIATFNITEQQQENISQFREQKAEEINTNCNFLMKGIEEQAQLEIFLEKYYPNTLKSQI